MSESDFRSGTQIALEDRNVSKTKHRRESSSMAGSSRESKRIKVSNHEENSSNRLNGEDTTTAVTVKKFLKYYLLKLSGPQELTEDAYKEMLHTYVVNIVNSSNNSDIIPREILFGRMYFSNYDNAFCIECKNDHTCNWLRESYQNIFSMPNTQWELFDEWTFTKRFKVTIIVPQWCLKVLKEKELKSNHFFKTISKMNPGIRAENWILTEERESDKRPGWQVFYVRGVSRSDKEIIERNNNIVRFGIQELSVWFYSN